MNEMPHMPTAEGRSKPRNQAGLSLVELLVAMLVALIILIGVVQVFQGNFVTSRYQESLAIVQENGRFAINAISRDLRQAGYLGCTSFFRPLANHLNSSDAVHTALEDHLRNGLEGWDFAGTAGYGLESTPEGFPFFIAGVDSDDTDGGSWTNGTFVDPEFSVSAINNSDILRIWGALGASADVETASNTAIEVDDATGFNAGDLVVLNDCQGMDVVQVCAVSGDELTLGSSCTPGNDADALASAYENAQVAVITGATYLVADTNGVPVLRRYTLTNQVQMGNPQDLVEGIENIQFLYGVDTSPEADDEAGDPFTTEMYVPASAIDRWNKVTSVRIFLMAASLDDNVLPADVSEISYRFMGEDYDAPDRRIRQVISRTINIRNKMQ